MKTKILLTGGNGFIGKNILESHLAAKYDITAPRSFELNLADTEAADNFFKDKQFDVVLHSATKPGHRNAKDLSNLFYTNVRMFENLERNKAHFGKLINFGSGAVYDVSTNITDAREESIFNKMPKDEHGFCKYVVAKQIEKLDNFIDLNIFGIFGKHEDYAIRFISNAVCKAIKGLPITLRQNRRFSYLFVEDLIPVLEFLIENKAKYNSYNIVPDEKAELLALAQAVKELAGGNIEIKVAAPGYGLDYTGNNDRIKKEIPGLKFTPMRDAVAKLYNFYKSNEGIINTNALKEDK
ncbi:GDP-L-fucose synthase [Elusimicrobium simillimum]|uniref:NAD-dependent epimerase/dehydratase family protein n=1 Tax=Elusimicrobium simillimum TaxID=3143438 RepID=UPI003C6F2DD5